MVCVAAISIAASACGSGRSADAYCSSFKESVVSLHDKYVDRANDIKGMEDPLAGIFLAFGSVVEAQGDLVVMFDKLEAKAPDEIHAETAAIRDSLKAQLESTGKSAGDTLKNPLDPSNAFSGLGSALVSGLANMGSYRAVDKYVKTNCDLSFLNEG